MTTTTTMPAANKPSLHLIGALAGLILALGYAGSQLMTSGHASFNTTNLGVVWGLPIVIYDYFLLTSTGLTMVAGLSLVLGLKDFDPIAKRCIWLAIAGLVGGVAVLFLELGYPLRALYAAPLNLQTASPLFWKILLVGAYAIVLVLLALRLGGTRDVESGSRPLASLAVLLAIGVTLMAGSVYGMMSMRPFWFGGETPVAFLIESFIGGIAFTVFFTYLAYGFSQQGMSAELKALLGGPLGKLHAAAIALHLMFVGGRALTGLWSNAEGLQVWQHISSQPLFHIGLWGGTVVPLVLLAMPSTRQQPSMQILASALVMVGLLISRYEFIVGGQMVPLFKGSWARGLVQYTPSATEWALLFVGVFLANVVYAAAEWWFNARRA
jgi:molybdopterin-containing oxidoreductase family membrane subunit